MHEGTALGPDRKAKRKREGRAPARVRAPHGGLREGLSAERAGGAGGRQVRSREDGDDETTRFTVSRPVIHSV